MTPDDTRLELLDALIRVTEEQLVAARTLATSELDALNERQTDLLFELRVASEDPLPADPAFRRDVATRVAALRSLHRRVNAVTGSVIGALERISPRRPTPTYGPGGRLRGA